MNQKIVTGAVIGSVLAGIGFLAFHPGGKKLRRKLGDIGLDAADKIIDILKTTSSATLKSVEADMAESAHK